MYASPERAQQIAELTSSVPSCRPLNRDQSLLEVPLRLRDHRATSLRISLPPTFPQGRPGLAVTHPVRHPWVDGAGRLSFPAIDSWTPGRSRLAAVVREALGSLAAGGASPPLSPQSAASAQASPPSSGGASQPPSLPQEFAQLTALSTAELAELIADEAKYIRFVRGIAASMQLTQVTEQLRRGNADLAAATLEKEGELAEVRNQIAIIRSSEYAAAKEAFDTGMARQQAVLAKVRPAALVAALGAAAAEADAASEACHQRFLAGEQPSVEAFLQEYVKLRCLHQTRELKRQAAQQTLQL